MARAHKGGDERPHFSASQVEAFMLCPRKWHFRWCMGRPWPKTRALAFGTEIAEELEHWWRDGAALKHRLAKAASRLVPPRGTPECYVEQACEFEVVHGWLWVGRVDFLDLREKVCPTINDYKTVKLREYAKKPAQLASAVQMLSYARWLFLGASQAFGEKSPVQTVRLRHINMEKEGPGDVWAEEVIVTPEHVAKEWTKVEATCERMVELSHIDDANKIVLPGDFGFSACRVYGSCPHVLECVRREKDTSPFFDEDDMVDKQKLRVGVVPPDAPDPYAHLAQSQQALTRGPKKKTKLDDLVARQRASEVKFQAVDVEFSYPAALSPPPTSDPPAPPAKSDPPAPDISKGGADVIPRSADEAQEPAEALSAPMASDPPEPPAKSDPPAPPSGEPQAPQEGLRDKSPPVSEVSPSEPQGAAQASQAPRMVPPDHPWGQAQGPLSEALQREQATADGRMAAAVAAVAAADRVMADPGKAGALVVEPGKSKFVLYVNCLPYRPLQGKVVTLDDYLAALQQRVIESYPQRAPDVRVGEKGYEILSVAAEKHLPECDVVLATTGTLSATTVIEVLRRHAVQTWVGTR
jgi:hypothetical protein